MPPSQPWPEMPLVRQPEFAALLLELLELGTLPPPQVLQPETAALLLAAGAAGNAASLLEVGTLQPLQVPLQVPLPESAALLLGLPGLAPPLVQPRHLLLVQLLPPLHPPVLLARSVPIHLYGRWGK